MTPRPCKDCMGINGHHVDCPWYVEVTSLPPESQATPAMPTARALAQQLRTSPEVTPGMILQAAAVIETLCDVIERA